MPMTGGCRCGRQRYEISGPLGLVFNCQCRFCRQIHGAAFTTIAVRPRASSRPKTLRFFCGVCASPVCNHPREAALLCLVVSSLDRELDSPPWAHFNTESMARWYTIDDGLPEFATVPDPEQWEALTRSNAR